MYLSRNRTDLSTAFLDLVEAAQAQVPAGVVLDGELVVASENERLAATHGRPLDGSAQLIQSLGSEPISTLCYWFRSSGSGTSSKNRIAMRPTMRVKP